jgi:5-methyltetrahydrofolate--homocysteine methyltransferase
MSLDHPDIVSPQFYGTSQVLRWDVSVLLEGIDTVRFFKGYFGEEFVPVFESLKKEILSKDLLDPAGLYGIFPVYTDDTRLVVLDSGDFHTQRAEFVMRVEGKQNRSIADYFRPDVDVMAVQIVTVGKAIGRQCARYRGEADKNSLGFCLDAIAKYLTEQLANKVTAEIRRAFFIPPDRGRRYGFGYPGLPGVEEQAKLFDLLSIEERLGVSLTPGFQMDPEHSSLGIFVHHPQAVVL